MNLKKHLFSILFVFMAASCSDERDLFKGTHSSQTAEEEPEEECKPPARAQDLKIVINEIMLVNEAALPDEDGEYAPWLELYNPNEEAVHLGNVYVSDDFFDTKKWLFPCVPEARLEPGGFLLVLLDGKAPEEGTLEGAFFETGDGVPVFHAGFAVNPALPFQAILFGGAHIINVKPADFHSDSSMGLSPDGDKGNYVPLETPTPGRPNAPPAREIEVVLNEVMLFNETMVPDAEGDYGAWVELYNPADDAIDLSDIGLSDDPAQPLKWRIPVSEKAVVAAHGFLVVFLDGKEVELDTLHADFTVDPGGDVTLVFNGGSDRVTVPAIDIQPDKTLGTFPDGEGAFAFLTEPTPGSANSPPESDPEAAFIRADIDENGIVDEQDLSALQHYFEDPGIVPACFDRYDVNDDGKVSISDIFALINALKEDPPAVPPPYPSPGYDPTPDGLPCPAQ